MDIVVCSVTSSIDTAARWCAFVIVLAASHYSSLVLFLLFLVLARKKCARCKSDGDASAEAVVGDLADAAASVGCW